MAIRQSKYIDITSGVGGKSAVANRELIARVFTTNPLCGIGHVYEFDNADNVMAYFGSSSVEYKYAAKYFGFVSKNISKAKKISFFRWAPSEVNPYIASTSQCDVTISNYVGSNGKIKFNIGEETTEITVNLSSVESLNDVAGAIQTAIDAK